MPLKSKAQQRLAYASAAGTAKDGMPPAVAREFIAATPKKAMAKLPERVGRKVVMKRKSTGGGY
jgi:hypothetical protein